MTDAPGYSDVVYERGLALLKIGVIGVNGAMASFEDEANLERAFLGRPFRTCPRCKRSYARWFDYYGHIQTNHWEDRSIG